jgi:predicted DNA-binding transcriptional regulator AlpA
MIHREQTQPEFLTCPQVAERYGLSPGGIRSLVKRGRLPPPLKIGRSCRWSLEALEEFERQLRQHYSIPTSL